MSTNRLILIGAFIAALAAGSCRDAVLDPPSSHVIVRKKDTIPTQRIDSCADCAPSGDRHAPSALRFFWLRDLSKKDLDSFEIPIPQDSLRIDVRQRPDGSSPRLGFSFHMNLAGMRSAERLYPFLKAVNDIIVTVPEMRLRVGDSVRLGSDPQDIGAGPGAAIHYPRTDTTRGQLLWYSTGDEFDWPGPGPNKTSYGWFKITRVDLMANRIEGDLLLQFYFPYEGCAVRDWSRINNLFLFYKIRLVYR